MDLNGARRKNATRETTSTLKAWLNEHKKNPYPTKGEKIMLAIITKMTLTQVSTWFANARRRLKKENKMTWEPRNRVEDEDNNNEDDGSASGRKSADNVKDPDSKDSGTGSSEDGDRPSHHRLELLERGPCGPGAGGGGVDTGSEWSESRPDSGPDSPECLFERPPHLLHPAYHHLNHPRLLGPNPSSAPSPPPPGGGGSASGSAANPSKPRIWSLADMASKESDVHHLATPVSTSAFYSAAAAAAAAGKLISPLANRGPIHPHHPHHLHPSVHHPPGTYPRPTHHDFYRSFYGPAASHLAGGGSAGGGPGDVSLLETYSRTFGAGLGTGGSPAGAGAGVTPLSSVLSKAAVAVAAAAAGSGAGPPFALNGGAGTLGLAPASLTVAPSGASSSSSGSASEQQPPPQQPPKLSPPHQAAVNKA
ncbi:hypothetical protein C0J52_27785 [Blattella germanica]|nr:hypothetical protein C0J52_27785 [Blattella germanica]